MPTDTPDTSRAALEALAEQWRLARGATPSSNHEYINGLLDAGGRLAATLRALAARVVELEDGLQRIADAELDWTVGAADNVERLRRIARAALETPNAD